MFCRKCVQCINISRPEAKNMDISLIGWSHLGLWIVKNIKQPWHIPLEYRIFKIEWRILLISYLFLINLFCIPFSFGISDVQNRMRYITPNIFFVPGEKTIPPWRSSSSPPVAILISVTRWKEILKSYSQALKHWG